MSVTAGTIIDRAQTTLLDETGVRWSEAELLDYLNAGITAICGVKPDAYVQTTLLSMSTGTALGTIPADGHQFLTAIYNVTSGNAMRPVDRNHLDHTLPAWPSTAGAPTHFWADERDPTRFWVYPRPSVTTSMEISYAAFPTKITNVSTNIALKDFYETPLYYFVLAHAYGKNAVRGDLQKATMYASMFANSIGAKNNLQFQFAPRTPDKAA